MNAHFSLDTHDARTGLSKSFSGSLRLPLNLTDKLTQRQLEILLLLCEGKVNKQIAYEMGISEATVKAHMTAIFRKLGVNNRTQALLMLQSVTND